MSFERGPRKGRGEGWRKDVLSVKNFRKLRTPHLRGRYQVIVPLKERKSEKRGRWSGQR